MGYKKLFVPCRKTSDSRRRGLCCDHVIFAGCTNQPQAGSCVMSQQHDSTPGQASGGTSADDTSVRGMLVFPLVGAFGCAFVLCLQLAHKRGWMRDRREESRVLEAIKSEQLEASTIATVESLEVFTWSPGIISMQSDCALCLESFAVGHELRRLPCGHAFHRSCVDHWLLEVQQGKPRWCPMCKVNPAPADCTSLAAGSTATAAASSSAADAAELSCFAAATASCSTSPLPPPPSLRTRLPLPSPPSLRVRPSTPPRSPPTSPGFHIV